MVGSVGRTGGLRVLIVEDAVAAMRLLRIALERAAGPRGARVASARVVDHGEALAGALDVPVDVALIDANRHPHDRVAEASLSLLGGAEVAQRLQEVQPQCRIVVYSALASDPAINITVREIDAVHAVYDAASLIDHMAEALWSDTCEHQVPLPAAADYAALGVLPGARPWEALQVAMRRPDTWEAVARTQPHRIPEKRTREHLNIHLRPLLPTAEPVTYRHYVQVLRRVAGFGP